MPYAQRKPGVGRVRAFRDAIDDEFGHPDDELGFSWVPDAEERLGMPEPVHPDEGIETDVEPPKQPETVSDSRRRLEEAAAAHGKPFSFHENAEAELLVDLVKICDEARDTRRDERLRKLLKLRKEARKLGAEVTAPELRRHDRSRTRDVSDRQWPQYTLDVLVEEVEEIWREHGGKGSSSYYDNLSDQHDGPLIRLMLDLYDQAGVPAQRRPGRHSLHNAIRRNANKFPPP